MSLDDQYCDGSFASALSRKLVPSADLRKILHNAGWMMSEQAVRLLAGIFVGVLIARQLGPSSFGSLSYAQAVAGLLAVVASLGFNRMVVREIVEHEGNSQQQAVIMATVFAFRLVIAFVLYILPISLFLLLGNSNRTILMVLVGISTLASPFDCCDLYFQSQSQSRISAIAKCSAFFLSTAFKVYLLFVGAGLHAFAAAIALEYALIAIALFGVYRRAGLPMWVSPEWRLGIGFLRETWPDIMASFGVLFFMRSGQLMLESLRGVNDVGIYSAASRLSEGLNFIPVSLAASSFPKILRSRTNPTHYYAQIGRLTRGLVALSYVAGILASLLSPYIIQWLYGPKYAAAAPVLSIHIWCGLLVCLGTVSGNWLLAERKIMLSFQRSVLGLIVSVLLNFALIPRFGANGAAWATFLAMLSAYYLFDLLHPVTRRMFILKTRALVFLK
jgi:O-antigen/teichoic acid export membrane protein